MKKSIISGLVIVALGLLIALGPQFLFRVCAPTTTLLDMDACSIDGGICGCGDDSEISLTEICDEDAGGCGCGSDDFVVTIPVCHWSARALLGMGMLITALGLVCLLVLSDPKTQLGLFIGVFLSSIIALGIPHALIGGCGEMTEACRRATFPAITIISVVLLVYSAVIIVTHSEMKAKPKGDSGD